jgi:hypothetical protein
MISKTYILSNLKQLNSRFMKAKTQKDHLYFSKLAVLELCGWIETSMDDIVLRVSQKRLTLRSNLQYVERDIIGPTWGFAYKKHWKGMLIKAVGIITVEQIEKAVDPLKKARLESQLNNLKEVRDRLAHTYVKGTQIQIDSPSVTLSRFNHLYEGLKEFEKVIFQLA